MVDHDDLRATREAYDAAATTYAQLFQAGISGQVATIDVRAYNYFGGATAPLFLELWSVGGAYPEALDAQSDEARGRFAVRLLETKRPAFLTLHLLAVDHAQHETGPMSAETFAA